MLVRLAAVFTAYALIACGPSSPPVVDAGEPLEPDAGEPLEPDAGEPLEPDAGEPLDLDAGEPRDVDAGGAPLTIVTLGFDDGWAEQAEAAEYLVRKGLVGTFYVNSGYFGGPQRLTVAQLQAFVLDGHEVSGHTREHLRLSTLTEEQQRIAICEDRDALLALGFHPVTSLAYPFGDGPASARRLAAACGYTTARLVGGLRNAPHGRCPACPDAEPFPIVDRFGVRTISASVEDTTTMEELLSNVEAAAASGGWLNFVFHRFCEAPVETDCVANDYGIPMSRFERFVDELEARARASDGRLIVMTAEQVTTQPWF